jgi:hypothetical protein
VVAVDLETGSFRMIHELGYTALTVVEAAYDPSIQAMYLLLNGNTLRAVKVGNTTVVGGDVAVDISGRFPIPSRFCYRNPQHCDTHAKVRAAL